jgi:SWI/SNF chromatin-remodeling complex subunit SWI1
MQRQLDALNMAERIRTSSVSSAAGNVANPSAPMLPPPPSNLSNFLAQANPSISPLFFQDEVRGKPVLLRMIAELYNRKGTPLPPALTGVQTPAWNPVTSPFRFELGTEKGVIRLAGQDVDLFKLWQILFAAGLSAKVSRYNRLCGLPMMLFLFQDHT